MRSFLYFAGALQLLILIASAQVPQIFDWKTNLAALPQFLRQLFWVYGAFIVLVIIGFSALTFLNATEIAAGAPVARSLCGFIAIFWALRLFVQFTIFDARPFLTNWFYKLGYHGLTLIFAALVVIYTLAAFVPQPTNPGQVSGARFGHSPNPIVLKQGILGESNTVTCRNPGHESHAFPNQDYKR
jgi:hypothetical protein